MSAPVLTLTAEQRQALIDSICAHGMAAFDDGVAFRKHDDGPERTERNRLYQAVLDHLYPRHDEGVA
jgi:hypothetical protein